MNYQTLLDNYKTLLKQIKQLELPLISCRSKSGGAHVFLFIDGLVPAKAIRKKLNKFAFELGRANCEIFPKQDMLHVEKGDTVIFLPHSDIPLEYDMHQSLKEKYYRVQRKELLSIYLN